MKTTASVICKEVAKNQLAQERQRKLDESPSTACRHSTGHDDYEYRQTVATQNAVFNEQRQMFWRRWTEK